MDAPLHDASKVDAIAAPFIRKDGSAGPITAARLRRSKLVYAGLCGLGLLPCVLGLSAGWQAAGLGLLFPGAGFLAVGGWALLLLVVTLVVFALALIAWFGAAMIVAPIGVWFGTALLAGAMAHGHIWPAAPLVALGLVCAGLGCAYRFVQRQKAAELTRLEDRCRYLPRETAQVAARVAAAQQPNERELTPDELAMARYVLERALQPVGELGGFDRIDQFQTAALRYQINHLGYALALMQCHYTPSFHGYLLQAQRNLIEQYLQKSVWGYWIYESAWGHLNLTNPDPAGKDNVMLTGWFGLHLGLYTSATGDRRYSEPGSLVFRINRRRAFHHDMHSLARSVLQNFQNSEWCLYPCEPNWIYPICNHYGMTSLVLYDRLFGTSYAAFNLQRWLDNLDREFTDNSGSIIGLRSAITGIRPPFPADEAIFADFANCFAPQRAQRMWAISRHDLLSALTTEADGARRINLPGAGFDYGNYRSGFAGAYATFMNVAREFGDEEIAETVRRSLDRDCGYRDDGGVGRYTKASNLSNAVAARARMVRCGDFRKAVTQGPPEAVFRGPLLTEARYPDVLVARAHSDGNDLDLVLYPGGLPGTQRLRVERLRPGLRYLVVGAGEPELVADESGAAWIGVELRGRTSVRITPAAAGVAAPA